MNITCAEITMGVAIGIMVTGVICALLSYLRARRATAQLQEAVTTRKATVESTVVEHGQTVIKLTNKPAYFLLEGEKLIEPGMVFKITTDSKDRICATINDQNLGEILYVDTNPIPLPWKSQMG
jgi:hypothetical protein